MKGGPIPLVRRAAVPEADRRRRRSPHESAEHRSKINPWVERGPFVVEQKDAREFVVYRDSLCNGPVATFRARYTEKGYNVEEARSNAHRFAGCKCST